jgi:hypothetical protein
MTAMRKRPEVNKPGNQQEMRDPTDHIREVPTGAIETRRTVCKETNDLSNHVLMQQFTENTHLLHEEIIALEEITKVRGINPDGNIKAFCLFFMTWCIVLQVGKYGLSKKRQTN